MSTQQHMPKKGFQIPGLSILFTILLLAILIGTGVYAFIQSAPAGEDDDMSGNIEQKIEEMKQTESDEPEEGQEITEDNGEQAEQESESQDSNESTTDTNDEEPTSDEEADATTVGSAESITVIAEHGDGVTHLARRAIQQYENETGISLSAEQKLYAETTLKNQNYQSSLSVGESITFDGDSLSQVVTDAENLSPTQIEAWGSYTHLVPSLQ